MPIRVRDFIADRLRRELGEASGPRPGVETGVEGRTALRVDTTDTKRAGHQHRQRSGTMAKTKTKRGKLKNGTNPKAKPRGEVKTKPAPWDDIKNFAGATGPANEARDAYVKSAGEPEINPETGEVERRNPNGVKHLIYRDMLEIYWKRGVISARGYNAGCALRDAWCNTQKGQGCGMAKERVDSSPKPDTGTAIQADRMTDLIRISKHIERSDVRILQAVVYEGRSVGHLGEYVNSHARPDRDAAGKQHLREALDRLAGKLGC